VPSAVLLEAANLNNPEDQISLRDPAYRQALAEAVVVGIERHFAPRDGSAHGNPTK
jgi:N-acetylmuramoyl-L-alanine amidase